MKPFIRISIFTIAGLKLFIDTKSISVKTGYLNIDRYSLLQTKEWNLK